MNSYDLFQAIGEADLDKLLHSEQPSAAKRSPLRLIGLIAAVLAVLVTGAFAVSSLWRIHVTPHEGEVQYEQSGETVTIPDGLVGALVDVPAAENAKGCLIGFRAEHLPAPDGEHVDAFTPLLRDSLRDALARQAFLAERYPEEDAAQWTPEEYAERIAGFDPWQYDVAAAYNTVLNESGLDEAALSDVYSAYACAGENGGFRIDVVSGKTSPQTFAIEGTLVDTREGMYLGMQAVYWTVEQREYHAEPDSERPDYDYAQPDPASPYFRTNVLVLVDEEYGCMLVLSGSANLYDFRALEQLADGITLVPTTCPAPYTADGVIGMLGGVAMG